MSKKNNKKTNVSISKGVAINSFFLVKDFLSDEEVDALKEVDNAIDEMNIAFDAVVYPMEGTNNYMITLYSYIVGYNISEIVLQCEVEKTADMEIEEESANLFQYLLNETDDIHQNIMDMLSMTEEYAECFDSDYDEE